MYQDMEREQLKVQALLEKISNLVANYENQLADARVELTIITRELENYRELPASEAVVVAEPSDSED